MHPTAPILTFCAAMSCAHAQEPEATRSSFEALDSNGNGYINAEEAKSRRGLNELIAHYDENLDGRLSRKEYERLIQDAAHTVEKWAHKGKAQ